MQKPLGVRIKDRTLRWAEDFAYDLVGLPVAIAYLFKPRIPSPEAEPLAYLRAVYCRNYWRRPWNWLRALFAAILWPVGLAIYTVRFTADNGAYVRGLNSKGILRQIGEQLQLAVTTSMAPYWYYMYEIFDDHRRAVAPLYVQRYETKGYVYGPLQPRENDGMQDKARFARRCREAGVNAAPVLVELTGGEALDPLGGVPSIPKFDIFVKPRIGRGGRNAERWDYVDGAWRNRDGETLGESDLLARLAALSTERDYIVQPRAVNHPDLNEVNNGALATVRVVTARNEKGGYEATDAAFRMAIGSNHTVDNFHAGGIAAAVDMETGRLGPASNMGLKPTVGWCKVHPNTGAAIEGRVLPLWPQVIELACKAHAAFPTRAVVGWDIGILADGPAIIEGNIKPDLDIHQRVTRRPIGEGRLVRLLAYNFAKLG
jgi:Sugar-transfer associated ATP-grasp